MPELAGVAMLVDEILSRSYRCTMHDDRIDDERDRYVIIEKGRTILIDPLAMSDQDLKQLGPVEAICLTASCHERSAWRHRRSLKAPIYVPGGGVDSRNNRTTGIRPELIYLAAPLQSTRLGRQRLLLLSILNETGASCSAPIF